MLLIKKIANFLGVKFCYFSYLFELKEFVLPTKISILMQKKIFLSQPKKTHSIAQLSRKTLSIQKKNKLKLLKPKEREKKPNEWQD